MKAGARIDSPIYLQDVMATALDVAGVPKPAHVEFQSLLPALRGESAAPRRDAIYAAYLDLQRAVIHEGWKLILYPQAKVAHLYDLAHDPQEMRDLAADPAQAPRRTALFQKLRSLQQQLADPLDLTALVPPALAL